MSITFSTCLYNIHSKFSNKQYLEWLQHFISIVNEFYLVIYTDVGTAPFINTMNNPNIKIIIKPMEHFHNYKYKEEWKKNHEKNVLLNKRSSWELNMVWMEKVWFVKETHDRKYFETEMFGWCDAGYFRNRYYIDIHTDHLKKWANTESIQKLNIEKIHYACIDPEFTSKLKKMVQQKNEHGLPVRPIPIPQVSIGGGFFIIHRKKFDWWSSLLDQRLQLYFKHDYLVYDDQIILADCILNNDSKFCLYVETKMQFDVWFMFQRILL